MLLGTSFSFFSFWAFEPSERSKPGSAPRGIFLFHLAISPQILLVATIKLVIRAIPGRAVRRLSRPWTPWHTPPERPGRPAPPHHNGEKMLPGCPKPRPPSCTGRGCWSAPRRLMLFVSEHLATSKGLSGRRLFCLHVTFLTT